MEALFYNHSNNDAQQRRADLQRALHAFLADTSSRAAVRVVGLFVRIPTPSTLTVSTVAPQSASPAVGGSSSPRGSAPASSSSSGAAAASQALQADTKFSSRRRSGAQRLAWSAVEADRRLGLACEDAAELQRWLIHDALTSRRLAGGDAHAPAHSATASRGPVGGLSVVVVAYLAPASRDDLAVYESWQRCAEAVPPAASATTASSSPASTTRSTRRLSPLRRAAFVALSLESPTLLLSWAERPTRCHLASLLLPHQSLLIDLSWTLAVTAAPNVAINERGQAGRVTGQVLLGLFLHDVLPSLKLPKGDSRAALWLSYATLMAVLHPRAMPQDSADVTLAHSRTRDQRTAAGTNTEAFLKTHRLVRQLFGALFGPGKAAMGRTQAPRVLLGYGGAVSTLGRQLVHVAASGYYHYHHHQQQQPQRSSGTPNAASVVVRPAVDAALLRTRSLVDVYALFGVLVGQDRVDYYSAAAGFVRTAARRAAAASLATSAKTLTSVTESALVTVTDDATTSESMVLVPNVFVQAGARALARRQRRLERQRLGKTTPHLRPRDIAARRRRRAAERKRDTTTGHEAASASVAGEKRPRDASPCAEKEKSRTRTSVGDADGVCGVTPQHKKVKREATSLPPQQDASAIPSAGAALSWSVDLG